MSLKHFMYRLINKLRMDYSSGGEESGRGKKMG